ncbi:unnamed protein product [Rhodiola kirilowii]
MLNESWDKAPTIMLFSVSEMGVSKNIETLLIQPHHSWMNIEDKEGLSNLSSSSSSSVSSSFDSNGTSTSAASSDLADDASSQLSSGPLYGLSELMNHLPIKRGLSKHYNGKSQSFTSLSKVISVEDLAKKERFCKRKMKAACKSSIGGAGLDHKLSPTSPKPTICKKSSRNTHLSFVCHPTTTRISCSSSFAPPPSPRQSNLQC